MKERFCTAAAAVLVMFSAGCASSTGVTRMTAGRRIEGRYIPGEAYAAYVNGVVLETQGRLDAARAAYEEAIRNDPRSAELWTRLGALRCHQFKRDASSPEASRGGASFHGASDPWDAFARAAEIDASYEELWTERARCRLSRGELAAAATDAERAVSLDPDRVETVLVLVMVLERQGRLDEAKRWLAGLVAREPESSEADEAARGFAARTGNATPRDASSPPLPSPSERPSRSEVDAALLHGELDVARRLAVAARISSGALALRAAALGCVSFAREEADLVLGADPSDTDARVAALVAADLARDGAALARAATDLPESSPLSPLAALLLSEVLSRRIGEHAARPVRELAGAVEKSDDALVRAVAARQ